ncbi:MAG TPA: DNA replication/repair protein RecF [Chryseolinea sp.]|nr:DNA replication/repair protein RecF [Chryseolinea sp.]
MRLETLDMLNFKGYEEARLAFPSRINVLVGPNGSGKTNLLDAIYYLAFTKSAFATQDLQLVRHDQPFFMVKGNFSGGTGVHTVMSSLQSGARKVFKVDGLDYQKLSEHIGRYPVILFAPDDVDLIREGSEPRRRFFDSLVSQIDQSYLDHLIRYNHHLKQRNSLLRMGQERGTIDWVAVESYDHQLALSGSFIYERRVHFAREFAPALERYCTFIVSGQEQYSLVYESDVSQTNYLEGLLKCRSRDLAMQRTNFGIHRDDFIFRMDGHEVKKLGSQGQQKSFVIAMRLAQQEILKKYKGFDPILLLDDIFDKLDDARIGRLLELMSGELGQLFITDARPDRTAGLLKQAGIESSLYNIERGTVRSIGSIVN